MFLWLNSHLQGLFDISKSRFVCCCFFVLFLDQFSLSTNLETFVCVLFFFVLFAFFLQVCLELFSIPLFPIKDYLQIYILQKCLNHDSGLFDESCNSILQEGRDPEQG